MACDKENEIIHVQEGIQVIDLKQGCNAFSSYFRLLLSSDKNLHMN